MRAIILLAVVACASASIAGWGNPGWNDPNWQNVDAARAAHLAEVQRRTGEHLSALNAALARGAAPAPAPQAPAPEAPLVAPQPVVDNADVAAARQAHLAEVARQTGAAAAALAQARAAEGGASYIPEAADVAAARQAHLAEHAKINAARAHGGHQGKWW